MSDGRYLTACGHSYLHGGDSLGLSWWALTRGPAGVPEYLVGGPAGWSAAREVGPELLPYGDWQPTPGLAVLAGYRRHHQRILQGQDLWAWFRVLVAHQAAGRSLPDNRQVGPLFQEYIRVRSHEAQLASWLACEVWLEPLVPGGV